MFTDWLGGRKRRQVPVEDRRGRLTDLGVAERLLLGNAALTVFGEIRNSLCYDLD